MSIAPSLSDKLTMQLRLQKIRGSEDRYEASPTLKLLFPAEEVQALTGIYANLAGTASRANSNDEELLGGRDDEEDS
jgi:hypothetical protein